MNKVQANVKIVNLLERRKNPATAQEVAKALHIPLKTVKNNLGIMVHEDVWTPMPLTYNEDRRRCRVTMAKAGTYEVFTG